MTGYFQARWQEKCDGILLRTGRKRMYDGRRIMNYSEGGGDRTLGHGIKSALLYH